MATNQKQCQELVENYHPRLRLYLLRYGGRFTLLSTQLFSRRIDCRFARPLLSQFIQDYDSPGGGFQHTGSHFPPGTKTMLTQL